MKGKMLTPGIVFMLIFVIAISYAECQVRNSNDFEGPRMMDDQGPGFGPRDFPEGRDGPRERGMVKKMHKFYIPAAIREVMDRYQIKIQKVFLEAKESRIGLDNKRIDLISKLDEAVDKYKTDKQASKDIVDLTKEFNKIQDQINDINEKAMTKIHALHIEREKAIRKARDDWFKSIESDPDELDQYIKDLSERPRFPKKP